MATSTLVNVHMRIAAKQQLYASFNPALTGQTTLFHRQHAKSRTYRHRK